MLRRVIYPALAVCALGLGFSFNGCSCHAEMGDQMAKAPEPAPPPAPPPAEAPPPAPPPAEPAPAPQAIKLHPVGKAVIEGTRVQIPGQIEFDVDKASINHTAQSKEILNTLVEFMKENPNVTKLRIEGHTDNSGTHAHNMKLSQDRADSVVKWLSEHGCDKSHLAAYGYGETRPEVANDTKENKQKNRRTEFHVQEIDGKEQSPAPPVPDASATAASGGQSATAAGLSPAASAAPSDKAAAPKKDKK